MPAYLEVEYNAGRRPQPIPISVLIRIFDFDCLEYQDVNVVSDVALV